MSKRVIVGFHGRAGSGKDTAAEGFDKFLISDKGIGESIHLAFAKPLKDAAKILFNFKDEQLYDTRLKEETDNRWNKSPRQILQWLGTDAIRKNISEDFFLIHMKQRVEESDNPFISITDVRFPNEAKLVREMGGFVIEILRDDKSTGGTEHSNHSTEQRLSKDFVDYTVENNGTIDEFHDKINRIIEENL